MREPQLSPLHPIPVLLRRRLLTLSLIFAPVAGFTTIAFFWVGVLPTLRQGAGVRPAAWTGFAISLTTGNADLQRRGHGYAHLHVAGASHCTEPVDAISDIYSLGGVAYFLLTGVPPFLRATASEMLAAHVRRGRSA